MGKTAVLLFLLSTSICSSFCQDSTAVPQEEEKRIKQVGRDVRDVGSTIAFAYARPFHWKKKEWLQFAAVGAATTAALFADESVRDFFARNESQFSREVAKVGDFLGQPEYNFPFYMTMWGSGILLRNDWMRQTGAMVFASYAISGIIQTISKEATGRGRPSAEEGNLSFKPFEGGKYHSFPSGHAMLSISTAWVLARQTEPLPLKILFFSMPAVVSWSRLHDNAHWFSDIILGNALGIACAETVLRYYPKIQANDGSHKNLVILPTGTGVFMAYNF